MRDVRTIALAGNPNVGKSTIFNALTGSQQHVGNWPGKTVEKKEGLARIGNETVTIIDLPGTYSLNAFSLEEVIARDFLISQSPGAVVAVADASNLERNLYLVVQLRELELPLVLVLNMADTARQRGLQIDAAALGEGLGGIPVIETVGSRGQGIAELREAIACMVAQQEPVSSPRIDYGPLVEAEIAALQAAIERDPMLSRLYLPRWLAIKLLEGDNDIAARLEAGGYSDLVAEARAAIERITAATGDDAETLIADRRYRFIGAVVDAAVTRRAAAVETVSDRIDRVLTHPVWGVPFFLLLMWLVFQFTANVSAPFLDWVDGLITGPVTRWARALFDWVGAGGSWAEALAVDGALTGVGGVLVFVPVLLFLYVAMAMLEDSGYMARSALVMDRLMRTVGLPGKSFLPLMVGFGCTVPAIYATRTLENEDDRRLTAFLAPFMSCGARLPVYVVFGAAFFGENAGNLVFGMYLVGISVALASGLLLRHTLYRNKPPQPLVLEMPPYRLPVPRNIWRQVWARTASFLHNAATIIFASSIVIWFLLAIPTGRGRGDFNAVRAEDSLFGSVSHAIAPAFDPAGLGEWQVSGSLITGFVAKEAVIGTMSQIYVDEAGGVLAGDDPAEAAPSFGEDLGEIATSFGEAVVLTAQETANILPRTVNLVPGVALPEADWLGQGDEEDTTALQAALTRQFTAAAGSPARGQLAAVAFNLFVLLYVPCMATVAAMRHEFGTRWMLFQVGYTLVLAWLAAVVVYQGGRLLGVA